MKLLQQYINERLVLSKNKKQEITWDLFIEALLNHNQGTLYLTNQKINKDNIQIFVTPPDDLSGTILGKLKGSQVTKIYVGERERNKHNKHYIGLDINSGFQSGLTILDIDDLRDVLGEEQIEKIYYMVL